nr:hypothetical protein OH837_39140 [Streptomyces canus]
MSLRLSYLTITNAFAALRLLPISNRDRDAGILVLRHQIMVLERKLREDQVKFTPEDRTSLAALLMPLPRQVLRRLRLLVQPDTVLQPLKREPGRDLGVRQPGRHEQQDLVFAQDE